MTFCVGVLALQGGFVEHIACCQALGVLAVPVRTQQDAQSCQAFIVPGGESTSMAGLYRDAGLDVFLRDQARAGVAIWGTCAGAVLCARQVEPSHELVLDLVPVTVRRNAYGAQCHSGVVSLTAVEDQRELGPGVLIRAPHFEHCDPGVIALAQGPDQTIMAVAKNRCLLTSFHPELSFGQGFGWHQWFVDVAQQAQADFSSWPQT